MAALVALPWVMTSGDCLGLGVVGCLSGVFVVRFGTVQIPVDSFDATSGGGMVMIEMK
jgi:hypothetical protein